MTEKTDILVVGGGVMGLTVAYHLLKSGLKTTILESEYLNAGSTGRNMGVVKTRIPEAIESNDHEMIQLAEMSLRAFTHFSTETGINIFLRKSGCLTVAKNDDELEYLHKQHEKAADLGERDEVLTADEIQKRWRYINSRVIKGGAYSPKDIMVHPFGVTWALVESIKRLNGNLQKLSPVEPITRDAGNFKAISTRGEITANKVVLAAGSDSADLVSSLGHKIPMNIVKKEMLISEAMRPFFGPTIERLSNGYQIAQTMRGEIMGTIGEEPLSGDKLGVTSSFLTQFADETIPLIPAMKNLRILRQWGGNLTRTADKKPIIGELEDGLFITCGFNDYGLALAPAVGILLAAQVKDGKKHPLFKSYDPHRFS